MSKKNQTSKGNTENIMSIHSSSKCLVCRTTSSRAKSSSAKRYIIEHWRHLFSTLCWKKWQMLQNTESLSCHCQTKNPRPQTAFICMVLLRLTSLFRGAEEGIDRLSSTTKASVILWAWKSSTVYLSPFMDTNWITLSWINYCSHGHGVPSKILGPMKSNQFGPPPPKYYLMGHRPLRVTSSVCCFIIMKHKCFPSYVALFWVWIHILYRCEEMQD